MGFRLVSSVLWFSGAVSVAAAQGVASTAVQPALGMVQQTLGQVHVERWKGSKALREEAAANIASIHRDMDSTLPGLLATADAAPHAASALLPAVRNLDALYDVLLRVTITAETMAPQDQAAGLEQALNGLESARRSLADQTQSAAVAEEQQVHELQTTLASRPAVVAAPLAATSPAPVPPPHPKKKKPSVKKTDANGNPAPTKN